VTNTRGIGAHHGGYASRRVKIRVVLSVFVALLVGPHAAGAAAGIVPLAPLGGSSVPRGHAVTFRMHVSGPGQVWVHVCRSGKRSRAGIICGHESVGRARRGGGGVYRYTPRMYDFPGFWLNRPGTYYWQAYRIHCVRRDCRQQGPVVRFRVA
jgi:hypothetical protein